MATTDYFVLRMSCEERDWLLNVLERRRNGEDPNAPHLYDRLAHAEPRDGRIAAGNLPPLTELVPAVDPRWLPTPDSPAEARAKADRKQILDRAEHLIAVDRAATYGDAGDSFRRIGVLWSALLDHPVDAADVARMMIAMKLSRLTKAMDHADSWVDIAGYAALGAEIAEVEL